MKPFNYFSFLFLIIIAVSCSKNPTDIIIGEWEGQNEDGHFSVFITKSVIHIPGNNENKTESLNYKIIDKGNDFVLINATDSQNKDKNDNLKIKIIDENKIEIVLVRREKEKDKIICYRKINAK